MARILAEIFALVLGLGYAGFFLEGTELQPIEENFEYKAPDAFFG